jgi:hypothetical protein
MHFVKVDNYQGPFRQKGPTTDFLGKAEVTSSILAYNRHDCFRLKPRVANSSAELAISEFLLTFFVILAILATGLMW